MFRDKEPWADFVGYDLFGYEYNIKYPPNKEQYGNDFGGYATSNQETFYYDFCILQYGVAFHYDDSNYEAEFTDKGPVLTNHTTNVVQGPFEDAVKLIEESQIKDKHLKDLIDELDYVVLH